jgi:dCMP deaminase
VVHAEVNAILNKCSASIRGATLYVALFPCNECAKVIIQSGIREVVYLHDIYHDTDACKASRIMFRMAGVKLRLYRPEWGEIGIELIPDVSNSINDQKQT